MPPPSFKLVFDKSEGRNIKSAAPSTLKKRQCATASRTRAALLLRGATADGEAAEDADSRQARVGVSGADGRRELHPAGDGYGRDAAGVSIIFIGNAAAIEAAVGPIVAQIERRDAALRPSTATLAGVRAARAARRRAAAPRSRKAARNVTTGARGRRGPPSKGRPRRGTEGNVVEFRKKQHARRERWLTTCALAASGNDLKRRAKVVENAPRDGRGLARRESGRRRFKEGTGAANALEGTSTGPRVWRLP